MRAIFLLLLSGASLSQADGIPREAEKYRGELRQVARRYFGPEAPVSTLAGQLHQESRWNESAKSPVGAEGLAQFMPSTRKWIIQKYPDELGRVDYRSGKWAIQAQVIYMRDLLKGIARANTECDRWWLALRCYNGGCGYIRTEQRRAADPGDRVSVGEQCYRSAASCRENLGYPERIIRTWAPLYLAAGWGGEPLCP